MNRLVLLGIETVMWLAAALCAWQGSADNGALIAACAVGVKIERMNVREK